MKKIHLESVDSTNSYAKRLLKENGLPSDKDGGLLIYADEQTAGRGRTGKTFSSLRNNGLYMTLVLSTDRRPEEALLITPAAAVAVWEVLAEEGCRDLGIKWVNDILDKDMKKICGILTEAVTDPESGIMTHAIIGVGLNAGTDVRRLPEELRNVAGTVSVSCSPGELAERIAERIASRVKAVLENGREAVLSVYEKHMILTGRHVCWEENGKRVTGKVLGITPQCHLVVTSSGGTRELDSGMVSVTYGQETEERV